MRRYDRRQPTARVRAKAGLPWPVTGTYICDKCRGRQLGESGVVATRCGASRGPQGLACNCAYFTLTDTPDSVAESENIE